MALEVMGSNPTTHPIRKSLGFQGSFVFPLIYQRLLGFIHETPSQSFAPRIAPLRFLCKTKMQNEIMQNVPNGIGLGRGLTEKAEASHKRSPGFCVAAKPMSGYVRAAQEAVHLMVSSITSVVVVPNTSSLNTAL